MISASGSLLPKRTQFHSQSPRRSFANSTATCWARLFSGGFSDFAESAEPIPFPFELATSGCLILDRVGRVDNAARRPHESARLLGKLDPKPGPVALTYSRHPGRFHADSPAVHAGGSCSGQQSTELPD
jgi:hypothetical protein